MWSVRITYVAWSGADAFAEMRKPPTRFQRPQRGFACLKSKIQFCPIARLGLQTRGHSHPDPCAKLHNHKTKIVYFIQPRALNVALQVDQSSLIRFYFKADF